MPKAFLLKISLLISALLPSKIIVKPIFNFIVNCPLLHTLPEKASDISYTISIKSLKNYSGIREIFSVGSSANNYTNIQTKAKHAVMVETYTVTFNLPLSTYLTSTGLYASFRIVDNNGSELYSNSFKLLPMKSETISLNKYLGSSYSLPGTTARPGFTYLDNFAIGCENLLDYFDEDKYYRLNLNKIRINYASCYDITNTGAYFTYRSLFPSFLLLQKKDKFDYVMSIPLTIKRDKEQIYFAFPEIMYVNPHNLMMSLDPINGFVATKYFYLPINAAKSFENETFVIKVNRFGPNKTTFTYSITYLTTRTLIGSCSGSEYCIVGEENYD